MATTIYAKSFTWNSITFSAASNGLLRIEYDHRGEALPDWVGDDEYPKTVFVVRKVLRVRVACREFKITTTPGTGNSNGVAVVKGKAGDTTMTFAALLLVGVGGNQDSNAPSETVLEFMHESSDGQASPVS
ncbi:MAG: hypothetical protein HS116_18510 [Planctomycetes bacterium]|nr:hypothetical protein [Planctomycetota bacterium]